MVDEKRAPGGVMIISWPVCLQETSLSFGDNAKVGVVEGGKRNLCVYLRLYAYINVFIRINTF
jgi:hypothetical protein